MRARYRRAGRSATDEISTVGTDDIVHVADQLRAVLLILRSSVRLWEATIDP